MLRKSLPFVALLGLVGCASGFDRAALEARLQDGSLQITDQSIAEARTLQPQLKFPCRIAVYLKPDGSSDWRWTPEDKAALEPLAAMLKQQGVASEVFPLPEMLTTKSESIRDLRLAAAQCGADVLLVIKGGAQTDSYHNPASALYLTVVGGYVIPGSHRDSLFLMEGCLFDVDNGYVYTAVQAEGIGKIVRPYMVIEDKDAIEKAKARALVHFSHEFQQRMRNLATAQR